MLIALVSAKGAPGVTTTGLALALSWPRPVVLADLDARGGDVLLTFGQGQSTHGRGVLGLQVATRNESWATALWSQLVALTPDGADGPQRWLLPGLEAPQHAGSMDWEGLAQALTSVPVDVIADCGSVRAIKAPAPVWTAADAVLLAVRPTLPSVHATRAAANVLLHDPAGVFRERLGSVVVGPGRPYSMSEVQGSLAGVAPVLGELPWDPRSADHLMSGRIGGNRFSGAPLMRAAGHLTRSLGERLSASTSRSARVDGGRLS